MTETNQVVNNNEIIKIKVNNVKGLSGKIKVEKELPKVKYDPIMLKD